ncbi:MAG TPA: TetR/AcrR family transcriptional regulator [Polyangiaceae bacterium]|jgi:AcrR family transcriptional regulator|nr:TetR/AcrR family transcriptional regulator [Polyangiaceae bacterium]
MGTPETPFKTRKGARTQARVLAVAIKLFQKRGFDKTSMRDIATQSKLGLGALYYYFASKHAFVQAFYQQVNAEVRSAYERTRPSEESLSGQLRHLFELKVVHLEPHRELFRVLLKQTLDPSSALSPLSPDDSAAREQNIDLFERLLSEYRPTLAASERRHYAAALWVLHLGWLLYWALDPSPAQRRSHELLDKLLAGLRFAETLARVPGFANVEREAVSALAALVPTSSTQERS